SPLLSLGRLKKLSRDSERPYKEEQLCFTSNERNNEKTREANRISDKRHPQQLSQHDRNKQPARLRPSILHSHPLLRVTEPETPKSILKRCKEPVHLVA